MNRCPDCDRPLATEKDFKEIPGGEGEHLCWSEYGSKCEPIDWRQRALEAENLAQRLRQDLILLGETAVDDVRRAAAKQREMCALALCPKVPHSACGDIQCPAAYVWLTMLVTKDKL